ncbi:helix-turn-helix domain-containing protein, partial [Corallococcus carmarthensis]|uniref:helix-turn-helix domain-containing protein n=1 Tax=Corallococcus carmarthensis TaxID=2316728 RepID=UPI0017E6635C
QEPPRPGTSSAVQPPVGREDAVRRKGTDVGEQELLTALRAHAWDVGKAAQHLGVPRSSLYDLIERSPSLRLASDLSEEEITRCFQDCHGDLDEMVKRLEVSGRALRRRLRELRLGPNPP